MNLEDRIRQAFEKVRDESRAPERLSIITKRAVIDADADADGRLDENPDTSVGSEGGVLSILLDGEVIIDETSFKEEEADSEIFAKIQYVATLLLLTNPKKN